VALLGDAVSIDISRPDYALWFGTPMEFAYGAFVVAAACFVAAVRELPIPWAAGRSGEQVRQSGEAAGAEVGGRQTVDSARQAHSPAVTRRWRYADDTPEAVLMADMSAMAMPRTAGPPGKLPFVRVGVCVACDRLYPDSGSSQIGARFVGFLGSEPVTALISAVTGGAERGTWTRLAGDGVARLEAALSIGGRGGGLQASAVLVLPTAGKSAAGVSDDMACLWLHIEPQAPDRTPAPPAGLREWHESFSRAVGLTTAFAGFLTTRLGLQTMDVPAARVGVLLQGQGSVAELVDPGGLQVLPGAAQSGRFQGFAIADRTGKPASGVACDLLTRLCDHVMHLGDFETVIAALRPAVPAQAAHGPGRQAAGKRGPRDPRHRGRNRGWLAIAATAAGVAVAAGLIAVSLAPGPARLRASPQASASARKPGPARVPTWLYQMAGGVESTPAVAGGTVYVGDSSGRVYALDAATGSRRWVKVIGGSVFSPPAVTGGVVYVGSTDHDIYALDAATGRVRWTHRTGGQVNSGPAVADGTVYVGSSDGNVYALDAGTGRVRWTQPTSGGVVSSPAVVGRMVYVGSGDGVLYALDAATGGVRWTYPTGKSIYSSPLVAGGIVYVGSSDDRLYAINAVTGRLRWSYATGAWIFYSSPVLMDNMVFIGSMNGTVYAVNAANGRLRWARTIGTKLQGSPAASAGTVYIGSSDHNLYALYADTGDIRWTHATGWIIAGSPVVARGAVYIGSTTGQFYALNADTG
jgi:outer membrane protein assembly factor BamB